jgi:hypothetical protein
MRDKKRGVVRRIDIDLDFTIKDFAGKNNMDFREASQELARALKGVGENKDFRKSFMRELKW